MAQNIVKIKVEEIPQIIKDLRLIFSIHFLKKDGTKRIIKTRNDMVKIKETIKGIRATSEEVKERMLTMQDLTVLQELQKQGQNIKDPKIIAKTWRRAIYKNIKKIVSNHTIYEVIQEDEK